MLPTIPLALAVAENAMREFRNQWLSGLQPIQSLETASDGRIHVTLKVVAGDVTDQHEGAKHQGVEDRARCQAGKFNNIVEEALRTNNDFYGGQLLGQQLVHQ